MGNIVNMGRSTIRSGGSRIPILIVDDEEFIRTLVRERLEIAGYSVEEACNGKDALDGGADNDTLRGGNGADQLTGGLGADTFAYAGANEGGKSTLCLVASGLAPASVGGDLTGELRIDGELREQTAQLLARKRVVEALQSNRAEAVHLLDALRRDVHVDVAVVALVSVAMDLAVAHEIDTSEVHTSHPIRITQLLHFSRKAAKTQRKEVPSTRTANNR